MGDFDGWDVSDDTRQLNPEHFPPEKRPAQNRGGGKRSKLEVKAASILKNAGLEFVEELIFHPTRKWRFDFAFPDEKVALEVEGGVFMTRKKSRHTTGAGFTADREKYNEAALLGWIVIQVTSTQLTDGSMLRWVKRALQIRRTNPENASWEMTVVIQYALFHTFNSEGDQKKAEKRIGLMVTQEIITQEQADFVKGMCGWNYQESLF